jgi:uncharacterized protein
MRLAGEDEARRRFGAWVGMGVSASFQECIKNKGFPFDTPSVCSYYRAPMSAGTLPQYIDVQKWADREATIEQVFPLSAFARLTEGAADDRGEVAVKVQLHRDAQGLFVVDGHMATTISLICQRCLEPVAADIKADVQLWLLRDEARADRLPDDADFLVLDEDGRIGLADALEDELILALPLAPMHENCVVYPVAESEDAEVEAPKRENPFEVLASLKGRTEKE